MYILVAITPPTVEFVNITLSNGAKLIGSRHSSYNNTVEFINVPYAGFVLNYSSNLRSENSNG